MKAFKIVFVIAYAFLGGKNVAEAQNINWSNLRPEQRNIINVNAGYDYAFAYGVGYGYHMKSRIPVVLNIEYSQPVGENIFDDFKTKIGGQVRVYQINNLQFVAKVQGLVRRYETDYVRMFNFGSDMSAIIGHYKPKWFLAGEVGFDKAIVTNFTHSDLFKEDFPGVKDGWYEPATGGNFYYGLQTGFSLKNSDVTLKAGKVVQQDFKTNPTVPFYIQVGYNIRF
jgi:hypothetical protein